MATRKRKSGATDYGSDDGFVDADENGAGHSSKRSKSSTKPSSSTISMQPQTDEDGNTYWELSKTRRVGVSEWKRKKLINIREYYEKDGKSLPGRKGISLNLEQYNILLQLLPQIERELKKDGEEVERPDYEAAVRKTDGGGDQVTVKGEDVDDERFADNRKSNIEATSDEDEGD